MKSINKLFIIPLTVLLGEVTTNCSNSMEQVFEDEIKHKNCIEEPIEENKNNNHITIKNDLNLQKNYNTGKQDDNNNIFDKDFQDEQYQNESESLETEIIKCDDSYEDFIKLVFNMFDAVYTTLDDTLDIDWDKESILENTSKVSIEYVKKIAQIFDSFNCNKSNALLASDDLNNLSNYIKLNNINTISLQQLFYYVLNRSRKLLAKTISELYKSIKNQQSLTNNNKKSPTNNLNIVKSSSNTLSNAIKMLKTSCELVFGDKDKLSDPSKRLMKHLTLGTDFAQKKIRAYFSNFDVNVPIALRALYDNAVNQIIIIKNKNEINANINISSLLDRAISTISQWNKLTNAQIQEYFESGHVFYSEGIFKSIRILKDKINPFVFLLFEQLQNADLVLEMWNKIENKIAKFKQDYFPTTEEDLSTDEYCDKLLEELDQDIGNIKWPPQFAEKLKQAVIQKAMQDVQNRMEELDMNEPEQRNEVNEELDIVINKIENFVDSKTEKYMKKK
ncbi:MAG: hypothetical protein IJU54_02795 [Alphaproteobacteria bacterium]|nr:hypothetical protein [Alphaproteobacteria bacterium]